MSRLSLFVILSYVLVSSINAQIGPEIKADGIVFPRLGIPPSAADGTTSQMIFNTSVSKYQYHNGSVWVDLVPNFSDLIGDRIEDDDQDTYIEVRENLNVDDIQFWVEGVNRARLIKSPTNHTRLELTDRGDNVAIGDGAGFNLNSTLGQNTLLGHYAGHGITTGVQNVMIGFEAGRLGLASFNTVVGYKAGRSTTSLGISNTFVGHEAGIANTNGSSNTFIGNSAGKANALGAGSTFVGSRAGESSNAFNNNFFGNNAGESVTSGGDNVMIGSRAGQDVTTGNSNVYIGNQAGNKNTTGNDNVYIGYRAGENITFRTGNRNVYIGHEVGRNKEENDKLRIDNQGISNPLIYGDFGSNELTINGDLDVFGTFVKGDVLEISDTSMTLQNLGGTDGNRGLYFSENVSPVFGIVYDGEGNGTLNTLHVREYSGSASDVLSITAGGFVGVGVSEPQERLDVNGRLWLRPQTQSNAACDSDSELGKVFFNSTINKLMVCAKGGLNSTLWVPVH